MQRIVIIGSGHLAHALWDGWHRNPTFPRTISVLARSSAHEALWPPAVWETVSFDPESVLMHADAVVVAVKPHDVATVLPEIVQWVPPAAVVFSPVAGWSIESLRCGGLQNPLVRMMPNVSAAIGASTTLVTLDGVPDAVRPTVDAFLRECGSVTTVDESLINPYTALIGSGPAYIFLLLQSLIDGGVQLGTDSTLTRQLVSSMVEGAARLARDRADESLDGWIQQVASPGGTTEALLRVLTQQGWPGMIQSAVVAASHRADDLGAPRYIEEKA